MRVQRTSIVGLLAVGGLLLSACGAGAGTPIVQTVVGGTPMVVTATPPPAATFKSKDPATLLVAHFGEPETLDPALDYENIGGETLLNIYETLVFYDKESAVEFVPQLATGWQVSQDSLTYTFTIRQGVVFHNGDPMTPEDVAYSFQRGLLQGGTASPQWLLTEPLFGVGIDDISLLVDPEGGLYDEPEKLQAADPAALRVACERVKAAVVADTAAGTVTFHLAQAWGPFLATLAQTWGSVMDKKWVTENGGWDGSCDTWAKHYAITSEDDPFTSITNGTGPFRLERWEKGQEQVLVRFDDYWRTEPAWQGGPTGPARLERVVIKKVEEWGTRFAMLQAGDVDLADVNRDVVSQVDPMVGEWCHFDLERNEYAPCEATGDAPLRLSMGAPRSDRADVFFVFSINNPEGGNPLIGSGRLDGNGIPPDFFADLHIRRAFNYCFDWETFITDALQGEAVQSVGIPVEGMIGYEPDGPRYTYDPAKCEQEFRNSTLVSADGKPLWEVGFRMQLAYNVGNSIRQTVAEILAEDISQVNPKFQVEVVGLPWAAFLRAQRARTLPVFITGWIEDVHDPHNWYVPYLVGTYGRRQVIPEAAKAELQELIDAGVTETDPAKRAAIYHDLNQAVYALTPGILLAPPNNRQYEQRWVHGWYFNPLWGDLHYYYYPMYKD